MVGPGQLALLAPAACFRVAVLWPMAGMSVPGMRKAHDAATAAPTIHQSVAYPRYGRLGLM